MSAPGPFALPASRSVAALPPQQRDLEPGEAAVVPGSAFAHETNGHGREHGLCEAVACVETVGGACGPGRDGPSFPHDDQAAALAQGGQDCDAEPATPQHNSQDVPSPVTASPTPHRGEEVSTPSPGQPTSPTVTTTSTAPAQGTPSHVSTSVGAQLASRLMSLSLSMSMSLGYDGTAPVAHSTHTARAATTNSPDTFIKSPSAAATAAAAAAAANATVALRAALLGRAASRGLGGLSAAPSLAPPSGAPSLSPVLQLPPAAALMADAATSPAAAAAPETQAGESPRAAFSGASTAGEEAMASPSQQQPGPAAVQEARPGSVSGAAAPGGADAAVAETQGPVERPAAPGSVAAAARAAAVCDVPKDVEQQRSGVSAAEFLAAVFGGGSPGRGQGHQQYCIREHVQAPPMGRPQYAHPQQQQQPQQEVAGPARDWQGPWAWRDPSPAAHRAAGAPSRRASIPVSASAPRLQDLLAVEPVAADAFPQGHGPQHHPLVDPRHGPWPGAEAGAEGMPATAGVTGALPPRGVSAGGAAFTQTHPSCTHAGMGVGAPWHEQHARLARLPDSARGVREAPGEAHGDGGAGAEAWPGPASSAAHAAATAGPHGPHGSQAGGLLKGLPPIPPGHMPDLAVPKAVGAVPWPGGLYTAPEQTAQQQSRPPPQHSQYLSAAAAPFVPQTTGPTPGLGTAPWQGPTAAVFTPSGNPTASNGGGGGDRLSQLLDACVSAAAAGQAAALDALVAALDDGELAVVLAAVEDLAAATATAAAGGDHGQGFWESMAAGRSGAFAGQDGSGRPQPRHVPDAWQHSTSAAHTPGAPEPASTYHHGRRDTAADPRGPGRQGNAGQSGARASDASGVSCCGGDASGDGSGSSRGASSGGASCADGAAAGEVRGRGRHADGCRAVDCRKVPAAAPKPLLMTSAFANAAAVCNAAAGGAPAPHRVATSAPPSTLPTETGTATTNSSSAEDSVHPLPAAQRGTAPALLRPAHDPIAPAPTLTSTFGVRDDFHAPAHLAPLSLTTQRTIRPRPHAQHHCQSHSDMSHMVSRASTAAAAAAAAAAATEAAATVGPALGATARSPLASPPGAQAGGTRVPYVHPQAGTGRDGVGATEVDLPMFLSEGGMGSWAVGSDGQPAAGTRARGAGLASRGALEQVASPSRPQMLSPFAQPEVQLPPGGGGGGWVAGRAGGPQHAAQAATGHVSTTDARGPKSEEQSREGGARSEPAAAVQAGLVSAGGSGEGVHPLPGRASGTGTAPKPGQHPNAPQPNLVSPPRPPAPPRANSREYTPCAERVFERRGSSTASRSPSLSGPRSRRGSAQPSPPATAAVPYAAVYDPFHGAGYGYGYSCGYPQPYPPPHPYGAMPGSDLGLGGLGPLHDPRVAYPWAAPGLHGYAGGPHAGTDLSYGDGFPYSRLSAGQPVPGEAALQQHGLQHGQQQGYERGHQLHYALQSAGSVGLYPLPHAHNPGAQVLLPVLVQQPSGGMPTGYVYGAPAPAASTQPDARSATEYPEQPGRHGVVQAQQHTAGHLSPDGSAARPQEAGIQHTSGSRMYYMEEASNALSWPQPHAYAIATQRQGLPPGVPYGYGYSVPAAAPAAGEVLHDMTPTVSSWEAERGRQQGPRGEPQRARKGGQGTDSRSPLRRSRSRNRGLEDSGAGEGIREGNPGEEGAGAPLTGDTLATLKYCHVAHSRKQAAALDPQQVKELVRVQLQSSKPIRAPWYRDAQASRQQAMDAMATARSGSTGSGATAVRLQGEAHQRRGGAVEGGAVGGGRAVDGADMQDGREGMRGRGGTRASGTGGRGLGAQGSGYTMPAGTGVFIPGRS